MGGGGVFGDSIGIRPWNAKSIGIVSYVPTPGYGRRKTAVGSDCTLDSLEEMQSCLQTHDMVELDVRFGDALGQICRESFGEQYQGYF